MHRWFLPPRVRSSLCPVSVIRRPLQNTVRAALVRNIKMKNGPLVLHIAGPSGVGKSMTARAVARSVMKDTDGESNVEWCGVAIINGHYYSSETTERVYEDSEKIKRAIADVLRTCPRSVVIMEDIQHMNGKLLEELAKMFDDTNPYFPIVMNSSFTGRPETVDIRTEQAIFILVSDLGEQSLSSRMSRADARTAVREATRAHWPTAKKLKFVHEVVPFLPLSVDEMAQVNRTD
eukprot:SAG22_NODE_87_length_21437_cov_14.162480_7_plen_234_part_00